MKEEVIKKLRGIVPFKFRTGPKTKTGFIVLAYVDARDVMDILDEAVGVSNWQRVYNTYGDNPYCKIGIKCGDERVRKSDTGEKTKIAAVKGEASDSFKRAAVNRGIGRFLYTLPMLSITKKEEEDNKWNITSFVKKKHKETLVGRAEEYKINLDEIASKYTDTEEEEQLTEPITDEDVLDGIDKKDG